MKLKVGEIYFSIKVPSEVFQIIVVDNNNNRITFKYIKSDIYKDNERFSFTYFPDFAKLYCLETKLRKNLREL